MKKKTIFITSIISAVIVFSLTTVFYLSYPGSLLFFRVYDKVKDSNLTNYVISDKLIEDNFTGNYSKNAAWYMAMHSYVNSLDDVYSAYMSANEYESLTSNLSGSYQGIGITVNAVDGRIYIKDVKESYPADKAGIMPGDYLHKINGEEYNASSLAEAVNKIKAVRVGETVEITVLRGNEEIVFDIKIENIDMEYVRGEMLDNSIAYIRIDSFGKTIGDDVGKLLEKFKDMKGLIVDVRSNPGGSLDAAVEVTDHFLGEGDILTVRDKSDNEDVYVALEGSVGVPVCVLIDEESASASEVFAGALKDHGKATLVGQKTYGKGVVQSIYPLAYGEALRITTARYYTPSGECIDGVGIYPDIEVSLPDGVAFADLEDAPHNDTQLAAALEAVKSSVENLLN